MKTSHMLEAHRSGSSEPEPSEPYSTNLARRVEELSSSGKLAEAIALTQAATSADPRDWVAWCLLGDSLLDWEDYDGAIAAYSRYVELRPNDALAYTLRSTSYSKKGNIDAAVRDVKRALTIEPANGLVLAATVDTFIAAGCPEDAVAPLEAGRARNDDPDIAEMLGTIYVQCIAKRWAVGDIMLCTSPADAEEGLRLVAKARASGAKNPDTLAHLAEIETQSSRALRRIWTRSIWGTIKSTFKLLGAIVVIGLLSPLLGGDVAAVPLILLAIVAWVVTGLKMGWKANREVALRLAAASRNG
jgi:tetratricopeptide (TPR) repeat protein